MRKAASHTVVPFVLLIISSFFFVTQAYAWSTSQEASAYCDTSYGKATIKTVFKNAESSSSNAIMEVFATDEQTDSKINIGYVNPGQQVESVMPTFKDALDNGQVRFDLKWKNKSGTDVRYAWYGSTSCSVAPSPSPSVSPSVSPTEAPTASPSATVAASPSPTTTSSGPRTDLSDGRSDGLGCSVHDCSGNKIPTGGVVAGASTQKSLPSTGFEQNMLYIFLGVIGLIAGVEFVRYSKFAEKYL